MARDYTKYTVKGLGENLEQKTVGFFHCKRLVK